MATNLIKTVARFPRIEPVIKVTKIPDKRVAFLWGEPPHFPVRLKEGEAVMVAQYDYPKRTMTSITRDLVLGTTRYHGRLAFEIQSRAYAPRQKPYDLFWYFSQENGVIHTLGTRFRQEGQIGYDQGWPEPRWSGLLGINDRPVRVTGAQEYRWRGEADCRSKFSRASSAGLWRVTIGKKSFRCLRRIEATSSRQLHSQKARYRNVLMESFIDVRRGRTLLLRRYNGPHYPIKLAWIKLQSAPTLTWNGEVFHLWYSNVSNLAL